MVALAQPAHVELARVVVVVGLRVLIAAHLAWLALDLAAFDRVIDRVASRSAPRMALAVGLHVALMAISVIAVPVARHFGPRCTLAIRERVRLVVGLARIRAAGAAPRTQTVLRARVTR